MRINFSVNVAVMLLGAGPALAQTQIDLRTQSRNVDFSAALSTKPIRTGAALPGTCSQGEAFVLTTAATGQSLNICEQTGVWAVPGGPSGASGPSQPSTPGPQATLQNASSLTIGGNCSIAAPCRARVAGTAYAYAGSSTITLASGTPTVRIYISDGSDGAPAGTVKVRNSAASGVTCSAGCVVENGQSAFPGQSIPLALWTATTPGVWDNAGQDFRAALATGQTPTPGPGIVITQGSSTTISVDNTTVTMKFAGTGAPAAIAGSTTGDLYIDTAGQAAYQCFTAGGCTAVAPGNWVQVGAGAGGGAASTSVAGMYATYNGLNYYPLFPSNGFPDAAAFTWMNQPAGATETIAGAHARHMRVPAPASNGNNLAVRVDGAGLSSTAFTIRGEFTGCALSNAVDGAGCFIGITDGTKVISFGFSPVYSSYALTVAHWPSVSATPTWQTNQWTVTNAQNQAFEIVLAGGTLTFYFSLDGGITYDSVYSESINTFFASPSGLSACWMLNNNWTGGLSAATLTDWKVD